MKTTIALVAVFAVVALPTVADAASKNRHHRAGHGAYARSQAQIACTQYGCLPVPRGCRREAGRTYSDMPSGFDVITCPTGTMYGNR
jgi:hypothetical protein